MVYHDTEDKNDMSVMLKRFYRWKYSGWIVIPFIIALAWWAYDLSVQQLEFFDGFSCPMLDSFSKGIMVRGHSISELDEKQLEHFNAILTECS